MTNYSAALDIKFHALADPTRRSMLELLSSGEMAVRALADHFPFRLPTILQHIKVLEEAGLIRTKKVGRTRLCQRDSQSLQDARDWLNQTHFNWNAKLERLESFLETDQG